MRGVFEEFGGGRPVTPEFPRIAYRDAMLWYGSDKPDLRNPIRMQVVSEHFRGSGFKVFAGLLEQAGNEVRAIPAPGGGSRAFCDRMNAYAQGEGLPGMGYIFWRRDQLSAAEGWQANALEAARAGRQGARAGATEAIRTQLRALGEGDAAFFLAGQPAKFEAVAGKARNVIGRELGLTVEDRFDFCWIVDFPMYERDRGDRASSTSRTTRSRCRRAGWRRWRRPDPLEVLGYQYDIVCNGVELSSGAVRNHKPEIMYRAFEIVGYDRALCGRAFRRDALGVPLRRAAACRDRAGDRPDRDAAGGGGEHPRGHHVPDEPARRGPDDGRAVGADGRAAARARAAADSAGA